MIAHLRDKLKEAEARCKELEQDVLELEATVRSLMDMPYTAEWSLGDAIMAAMDWETEEPDKFLARVQKKRQEERGETH